jgi:hypothetical protein
MAKTGDKEKFAHFVRATQRLLPQLAGCSVWDGGATIWDAGATVWDLPDPGLREGLAELNAAAGAILADSEPARNKGGRPTRRDEILAAFDELPKAKRMRLMTKGKTALYDELRQTILDRTGLPVALGKHAMSEALKNRLKQS